MHYVKYSGLTHFVSESNRKQYFDFAGAVFYLLYREPDRIWDQTFSYASNRAVTFSVFVAPCLFLH